ncbi:hypothetical protein M2432_001956 [Mycobacterium sp. OTB74]|nr:hypothetical protein [Mycobacterium sp. OTB74]
MGAAVLDTDAGWEFVRPAGTHSRVSMVGFRDRAGHGMDLRVTAIPAVTVVLSFGDDLVVERCGRWANTNTTAVAGREWAPWACASPADSLWPRQRMTGCWHL